METMTLERPLDETQDTPVSLIEQIIQLAEQPDPANVGRQASRKISRLQQELTNSDQKVDGSLKDLSHEFEPEIARLESILATLDSPLERETKKRVAREISRLKSERNKRSKALCQQYKNKKANTERRNRETTSVSSAMTALLPKYPFIKIKEVPWLDDKNKNPQIIPIHESDPTFTMQAYYRDGEVRTLGIRWGSRSSSHNQGKLFDTIREIFAPHIKTWLSRNWREEIEMETQYTFAGAIPLETKAAMQNARPDFKESKGCLLMLADARTLKVSRKRKPIAEVDLDPLIVGYHPNTPDLLWLVAAFDMTPIEALIMDKALKPFHERKKL